MAAVGMKRILAVFAVLAVMSGAFAAQPKTMVYSVRGADTLRADYYSVQAPSAPCVVFMFGGGFYSGSRASSSYTDYFEFLNERGYGVFSIDYRLGLKALDGMSEKPSLGRMIGLLTSSVDMAVTDLYDATAFLLKHAGELGVDADRILVCGSSAGAISVLTGQWGLARGRAEGILPAGFDYAGVISFAGAIYTVQGAPRRYAPSCPVMMFHGSADSNVPYRKLALGKIGFYGPQYLTKRMNRTEAPYYWCDFQDADHKIAVSPMNSNREQIAYFLENYVENGARLQITENIRNFDLPARKGKIGIMDYVRSNFGEQ